MSSGTIQHPKLRKSSSLGLGLVSAVALLVGAFFCEVIPTTGIKLYKNQLDSQFVLGQDEFSKREARLFENKMLPISRRSFIPHALESSEETAVALLRRPLRVAESKKEALNPWKGPPSTQLIPEDKVLEPESPLLLSIVADSQELFHPVTGVLPNFEKRGKDWEAKAWLTAKDHTGVIMEAPIGLRVHGGTSRKHAVKSFGLYFRKKYQGTSLSAHDKFFGEGSRSAEKIALINGAQSTRYMGAMVTEMAAIAGCKVSKVRPVSVYLNGQRIPNPYFLFEHQSAEFLQDYYDCEEPFIHRLKADNEKNEFYKDWRNAVLRDKDRKWSMKVLNRYFDIDDLCAWIFLITYTVTLDNNQGMYYYDKAKKDDLWKCLTWDLDGCFNRVFSQAGSSKPEYVEDPFLIVSPLRGTMFLRLIKDSPEFFDYYEDFCRDVLANKLTKETVMELFGKYERLAKLYENVPADLPRTMAKIKTFLETRHEFYLKYLQEQRVKLGHPPRKA